MLNCWIFLRLHIDWMCFISNNISKWVLSPDWGSLDLIFA